MFATENSITDNNKNDKTGETSPGWYVNTNTPQTYRSVYHRAMHSFRQFLHKLRRMTWRQIIWVVFLILLVSGGNAMQILTMNFWLLSFPASGTPGNYTVFALPGIIYSIIFVVIFTIYVIVKRPSLRFATHWYGWWILIGVGFCDTINSWMATYAASYTSEVLQALFTNLCPLYAVVMCKYILHDPRRYCNTTMVIVFVLTIGGILAASMYGLVTYHNTDGNKVWVFIFFASIPFRVLMNVWQELYMVVYTNDSAFIDWLLQRHGDDTENTPNSANNNNKHNISNDNSNDDVNLTVVDINYDGEVSKNANKSSSTTKNDKNEINHDRTNQVNARAKYEEDLSVITANNAVKTHREVTPPTPPQEELEEEEESYLQDLHQQHNHRYHQPSFPINGSNYRNYKEHLVPLAEAVEVITEEPFTSSSTFQSSQSNLIATDGIAESNNENKKGNNNSNFVTPALPSPRENSTMCILPTQYVQSHDGKRIITSSCEFVIRFYQGDDTIVKLMMLVGDTCWQTIFTLMLLPADALPWWGNSKHVRDTWGNFVEGIHSVFTIKTNFLFGFLYSLGFVFTYIGGAYLNHYSAALCSMVTQLSSPLTALLLVIIPSWNVQDADSSEMPWYYNVIAIVLLVIAAVLYVMWEEATTSEKTEGERELKRNKLRVQLNRYHSYGTMNEMHSVNVA